MIKEIIHKFPDENFHLRPHPLEKIETWQEHFSEYKNVKISKDGNINEQLVNSKILSITHAPLHFIHSFIIYLQLVMNRSNVSLIMVKQPMN